MASLPGPPLRRFGRRQAPEYRRRINSKKHHPGYVAEQLGFLQKNRDRSGEHPHIHHPDPGNRHADFSHLPDGTQTELFHGMHGGPGDTITPSFPSFSPHSCSSPFRLRNSANKEIRIAAPIKQKTTQLSFSNRSTVSIVSCFCSLSFKPRTSS